ncbi:MAG: nucleotidyltransferase domain-containing protein [Thermodesulfovibrionia bacterium]|nr:nucleotidyltransferase domain-containing protein [Thermodesulfovibrionia bacterium]
MKNKEVRSFCRENNIELLIVFGSQASGKIHPSSDIDVAVKFRQGAEISKLKLIYKLNDLFSGRNIDLVILRTETDPLLLFEIFLNGRLLYEKYPDLFDKERLRAWKLYIDTEKLRLMQRKYLKEFVRKMRNVA